MRKTKERTAVGNVWFRKNKRLIRFEDIDGEHSGQEIGKTTRSSPKSPARKPPLSILDLPDECIVMILEHLNIEPHETCELMKVCKKFYEISFSPRLWRHADFTFESYMHLNKRRLIAMESEFITKEQRRKMLATYLVKRKAMLSHLVIHFDIDTEMDTFRNVLDKCSLRRLKYVEIKWFLYWRDIDKPKRRKLQLKYFTEVLEKLSSSCPNMYFFKCQLAESCEAVQKLGSLKSIQCLELSFKSDTKCIGNSIEIILSSLTKLRELTIKVTQHIEDNFEGYTLESESLRYLNYSHSKGFRIKSLDLQNLHTLEAVDIYESMQGRSCPCLFDLIRDGCPDITRLNFRRSIIAGLVNFPLDLDCERQMHICNCDRHSLLRGFV